MKLRIAIAAAAISCAWASVAGAVTANATASATIVSPTQLTVTRNLAFGTIAKPTTGTATVTVASAATGTATPTLGGGTNAFIPTPGQAAAAQFHLVGGGNQAYNVSATSLSFTGQAGNLGTVGPEAGVASFGTFTPGDGNGTLPANGVEDIFVGGHFDITTATATQTYNGTLALTMTFN